MCVEEEEVHKVSGVYYIQTMTDVEHDMFITH